MDALYDKVDLYDTLKAVMQGNASTDNIAANQRQLADIESHMLHFLDNHDEQRVASPQFAGDADKGKPAMLVSALMDRAPAMVYFGQEVGEAGERDMGFGRQSRTSIFDYCGVPSHQRWMNGGRFDGGQLSDKEKALRDFYKRLLNFTLSAPALDGGYAELHKASREAAKGYDKTMFAFARVSQEAGQKLIAFSHFDTQAKGKVSLVIPAEVISAWQLADGCYPLCEALYGYETATLRVNDGCGEVTVIADALAAKVFELT